MKDTQGKLTYDEFINSILKTRGRFACGEEYHERHHIKPKCIGGLDEEDNLIDLFAREHFEAHRLLALENPDNTKLVYAWYVITHCKNQYQERYMASAEEYDEAKEAWSKQYSESIRGEKHWDCSGANNPNYGKPRSEETKKKISRANTGKPSAMKGKHHSENTRKNISIKAKERLKNKENHPWFGRNHSEESKKLLSELQKERLKNPENHPMYGKHLAEETRNKLREKAKERYKDPANHPNARRVVRLSDLKIYGYLMQAAQDNNISRYTMRRYCKQHKDFMYYDEYLIQQNDLKEGDQ